MEMGNKRRILAGFLAILTLAFSPGLVSYQAAALVLNGAASGRTSAVPVVPAFGANSVGIAPLSSAMTFSPSLAGEFSPTALGAPIPALIAPSFIPVALTRVPNGVADVKTLSGAIETPVQAADAMTHLTFVGGQLSAGDGAKKRGVLNAVFTGTRWISGLVSPDKPLLPEMVDAPVATSFPTEFLVTGKPALSAVAPQRVILLDNGLQPGDEFLTVAEGKPQVPAPTPAAPDAAVSVKALKWMYISDAIGMSVFILTLIAFPMVVIPAVGAVTYGVLTALGPLAAIALGPLGGMTAARLAPREGLAMISAIRAVLSVAVPLLAMAGMISFWPLLLVSIANTWQFSLLMTCRSAYTRLFAITDPKRSHSWLHIGNLTTIGFSIYFLLQVLLGSIGQIGGLVDRMSPMTPFWIAAAVNVGLAGLSYWKIPKIAHYASNAVAAVKVVAEPFAKKAVSFVKKFWKEIALFGGSVGVYAYGLPLALPLIGTGLGSPLWIAGALMFWVLRTDVYKSVMATPKIRNALLLSALVAGLIYPFQNLVMPLIAASHGAKALIYGQLLGAFFFGQLLSNVSLARLPEVRIPLVNKSIAAEKLMQAGVLALVAIWAGVRLFPLFPVSILAAAGAVAVGMTVIAAASRLTDRGWIKFFGVGLLAAIGVSLSWGFYPGIFASVMLLGLFVGPFFSAINAYISSNTDPKMASQTFGVSGSLFNALISFGYGLMVANTKAHGDPAFPSALTPIIAVYAVAAVLFLFVPRWLPGLPEKSLRSPERKKPAA